VHDIASKGDGKIRDRKPVVAKFNYSPGILLQKLRKEEIFRKYYQHSRKSKLASPKVEAEVLTTTV
jgi:hypothetical protein